jgi:hypothetical protein
MALGGTLVYVGRKGGVFTAGSAANHFSPYEPEESVNVGPADWAEELGLWLGLELGLGVGLRFVLGLSLWWGPGVALGLPVGLGLGVDCAHATGAAPKDEAASANGTRSARNRLPARLAGQCRAKPSRLLDPLNCRS